ncbi:hypothetical protein B0A48_04203 [Cryoendolithus antarcticus]|uniref:Kinetochore protein mis13 n=1 Tax=Cryoendolithus antarcticus TaxID=1507870 RepID=A0A1V8TF25_9PEZI|nr:hypothetical protein B0A48_04203 [Cryoendolithus antarcticus]
MSMAVTRSPLTTIAMNGGSHAPKRRSARLSAEGVDENGSSEPPAKKLKVDGGADDGGDGAAASKKRSRKKVYDQDEDGFVFTKGKKAKAVKEPAVRNSTIEEAVIGNGTAPATATTSGPARRQPPAAVTVPVAAAVPNPAPKKLRRGLPATPEREAASKNTFRKSKRLSDEGEVPSPHKAAHARSHAKHDRSPSPAFRPVTVEKKRRKLAERPEEEEKTTRIALPFADTPIITRNKDMRKAGGETSRRSSSGMRGKRVSSLLDEGRGNALPHAEVATTEFFKHISADLTEPRRMRVLLGWCGSRALPPKPEAPKDKSAEAQAEFQALQSARVIQEELSLDLVSNGTLSDWFSRDENPELQLVPLRKKPNPRNVANAAKADELERELERLKKERHSWDSLISSATKQATPRDSHSSPSKTPKVRDVVESSIFSPVNADLIDSPDRAIFAQLQQADSTTAHDTLQKRLQDVSANLEFSIDCFAESVHALSTSRSTAESLAERNLKEAAEVLESREDSRRAAGAVNGVPQPSAMDALRGLARVLNGRR